MTQNNGAGWICFNCKQPQKEPKGNGSQLYCKVCKPIVHKRQVRDWQRAHLTDLKAARPDLELERRKARG